MSCANSCSTAEELIVRAAQQLGDYAADCQFVTWTRAELTDYLNEAICQLASARPDAFAEVVDVTLRPGAMQELPDDYVSFVRLEANDDATATSVSEVSQSDSYFSKVLRNKRCLPGACTDALSSYRVGTAAKVQTNERTFSVSPPVPAGASPTVKASVIAKPPRHCATALSSCSGVPCKYEGAVVEWMLYRAWGKDAEVTGAVQMATMHFRNFYSMLGVQLKREAAFGSGYWQGAIGTGDASFAKKL